MLLERVNNLEDRFIDKLHNKLALFSLNLIMNDSFNNKLLNVLRIIYKDSFLNKTDFINLEHEKCIRDLCLNNDDYVLLKDSGFSIWKGILPHYGYEMTFISIEDNLSIFVRKQLQKYFSKIYKKFKTFYIICNVQNKKSL